MYQQWCKLWHFFQKIESNTNEHKTIHSYQQFREQKSLHRPQPSIHLLRQQIGLSPVYTHTICANHSASIVPRTPPKASPLIRAGLRWPAGEWRTSGGNRPITERKAANKGHNGSQLMLRSEEGPRRRQNGRRLRGARVLGREKRTRRPAGRRARWKKLFGDGIQWFGGSMRLVADDGAIAISIVK